MLLLSCNKDIKTHQIYIETSKKITNQQHPIHIYTNKQKNKLPATIETRGGYSINFPKQSYELDLENEISLAGLPDDDDWILNANFIDKTFLRHVISYEIFQNMSSENIAPKTQHVELFINNEYEGLYVLMEKLDKSTLKIEPQENLGFIFKDPHVFRENYSNIVPQKPNNFHQQTFPKLEQLNQHNIIENIRDFILTSNDSTFTKNIQMIFDINNIIDWHLLLLITNNSDGILKNFYLYKTGQDAPIRISPWDYDHSFGRDGDNELNLNTRKANLDRSILFSRLLKYDWYKFKLKQKWMYLNKRNILSVSGLHKRINKKYQSLQILIKANNEKWPTNHPSYYDTNNSSDEIEIMYNFIEKKHAELDNYFNTKD